MKPRLVWAPGALDCTAATSASALSITWSSTFVISAPVDNPAEAAGLLSVTPMILAPRLFTSLLACTPNQPCVALPVAMSSPAMRLGVIDGNGETNSDRTALGSARAVSTSQSRNRRVHADEFAIHVD